MNLQNCTYDQQIVIVVVVIVVVVIILITIEYLSYLIW